MPNLGGWEWVILAVVALVLFGGSKIAGFGKSAGRAIREFKEETQLSKSGEAAPPAVSGPDAPPSSAVVDAELVDEPAKVDPPADQK